MKIKLLCVAITALSLNAYSADQDKYLGKSKVQDDSVPKKSNILEDEFISNHSHYKNQKFWNETNSSKIVSTEESIVPLSDELFNTIKEFADKQEGSDISISNSTGEDTSSAKQKKEIDPPKKALVGHDHHHKYADIEASYSGKYDPSLKEFFVGDLNVQARVEQENWVLAPNDSTLLATTLSLSANESISYLNFKNELSLAIAKEYFETFEIISADSVHIKELNEDDEEIMLGKFEFVIRDVCILDKNSGQSIMARYHVSSVSYNVDEVVVYSGMRCGD